MIKATDERYHEAELYRTRGELQNAMGDSSGAQRSYHRACAVAQRQGAKLLELKASISLARHRFKQDKRSEAQDLLAPIYGWFTEGFDAPDLAAAKTLLDELA